MVQAAKTFLLHHLAEHRTDHRMEDDTEEEIQALREGLDQTKVLIHQAYAGFNRTGAGDQDLIESYVFEINALQARYAYLLRRIKELGGHPEE
ncbi:MAG: YaaL family protein [Intestinimonas sp.]|jgi:formyltetrahydrofolate synthetase|nr:YaaL family protein [Intestinimonas sp.]